MPMELITRPNPEERVSRIYEVLFRYYFPKVSGFTEQNHQQPTESVGTKYAIRMLFDKSYRMQVYPDDNGGPIPSRGSKAREAVIDEVLKGNLNLPALLPRPAFLLYGPGFGANDNAWAALALLGDERAEYRKIGIKVARFMERKLAYGKLNAIPAFCADFMDWIGDYGSVSLSESTQEFWSAMVNGNPFHSRNLYEPASQNPTVYADANGISGLAVLRAGRKRAAASAKKFIKKKFLDAESGKFFSYVMPHEEGDKKNLGIYSEPVLFLKAMGDEAIDPINAMLQREEATIYGILAYAALGLEDKLEEAIGRYPNIRNDISQDFRPEADGNIAIVSSILGMDNPYLDNLEDEVLTGTDQMTGRRLPSPIMAASKTILALRPESTKRLLGI